MNSGLQRRWVAVVKSDCPTCQLVAPVFREMTEAGFSLDVFYQDDGDFLDGLPNAIDDTALRESYARSIESVPTLLRLDGDTEEARIVGWDRALWTRETGLPELGAGLKDFQPACGSKSVSPGVPEVLEARYGSPEFGARPIDLDAFVDPVEACFDRGWSDGLPVVPPTPERVLRMLGGTTRDPQDIVGIMPPDLVECTVEKVAINAVMAGCRPEYMPVVLGALEAALEPNFTLHGLTCSTCFSSPVIVVNGPITRRIGMNSGLNALGQGNRANATIGRAVNLVVRNVGGGKPGGIDRATLGAPSKYTFCFAEDESDPRWTPLATSRGVPAGKNAVTLFQGDGVQGILDQRSRTPEELTRSIAQSLLAVVHVKICEWANAILVLAPEHYSIFSEAGWGRDEITAALHNACTRDGQELVRGALGIGEGIDPSRADERVPKFHPDGLLLARAGGPAGLYSAIITGWPGGRAHEDSVPITKELSA